MSLDERAWRKAAAWGLSALVLLAAALWVVNATSLPVHLARLAAGSVSDRTGWSLEFESARFSGPTRLLIENVEIGVPGQVSASAPRAYVAFNPFSLFGAGRSGFDWGRIDLVAPHLVVPSDAWKVWRSAAPAGRTAGPAGQSSKARSGGERPARSIEIHVVRGTVEERRPEGPAALWRADGEFAARLDGTPELLVRSLDLELRAENVSISAKAAGEEFGSIEWSAEGPADLVLSMLADVPWEITGSLSASGTYHLARGTGELSIAIKSGDVRWSGLDAADWIAFDTARLEVEHSPGEYDVKRVELTRGEASLSGEGSVRPASEEDGSSGLRLELSLLAKGLVLPEDIPAVRAYGLSGRAEFSGVLAGTLADPEISGRLRIADGTVWNRPIDRGEGVILLRKGLFRFGKTELVRAGATYEIHGEWSGVPSRTEIQLEAANGEIAEMLLAAGIDFDASGTVDGSFSIAVDGQGARVEGEGTARGVRVLGQPLDEVQGRFAWSPGLSRFENLRLRLGDGIGTASGEIVNGAVNVNVTADRWPAPEALADRVSGWLSFTGSVGGSVEAPAVQGRVRGGSLKVGSWSIDDPAGDVSVTRELVRVDRLRGVGAGDGLYELTGVIRSWMEEPVLDLDVSVEGASLSALLRHGGWRLPALLFDGQVSGMISLEGRAGSPTADFDLSLRDEFGVADPMRLRFQIVDGKFKLGRLGDLLGLTPS